MGAFISTVFYPVNIIKTHMQCTVGGPFNSLWMTSRIVYVERERSLRKMFYGVHVNYTRFCTSSVNILVYFYSLTILIQQTCVLYKT